MKIKQVCEQTGMTERAVRFYIEKGLLHPEITERGERSFVEFSEADIRRIEQIALLRKLELPVAAVAEMLRDPSSINTLLAEHHRALSERSSVLLEQCKALDTLSERSFTSVEELCEALQRTAEALPPYTPDLQLNFGKDDPDADPEAREQALARFCLRMDKEVRREKRRNSLARLVRLFAPGLLAILIPLVVLYLVSCIPRRVSAAYDGIQYRRSAPEAAETVHVRVEGKLTKRWFAKPSFSGLLEISNMEDTQDNPVTFTMSKHYHQDDRAYLASVLYVSFRDYALQHDPIFVLWTDIDFSYVAINLSEPVNDTDESVQVNRDLIIAAPAASPEEAESLLALNRIIRIIPDGSSR